MCIKSQLEKLTEYLVSRSKQEYQPYQIVMAIVCGSSLELIVVPILLVIIGKGLDYIFLLRPLFFARNIIGPSVLAFCLGLVWVFWSIWAQHIYGRGTPLPLIPTKTLLVSGPYKYTRNPMAFGAFFWLLGWAFLANSPCALMGVLVFMAIILLYIKLVEEKELEERFGQEYRLYKEQTPFIIPRLMVRR